MDDFDIIIKKKLASDGFKKEWEASESEYNFIKSLILARKECHMTQKQLADATGIDQADISKIETGNGNPELSTLAKLAEGMGMVLTFKFVQKEELR